MRDELFVKYVDSLISTLDYNLNKVIYNEDYDQDQRIRFGFAQYVMALDKLRTDITSFRTDVYLDPYQLDVLTSELTELWDRAFTIIMNAPVPVAHDLPEYVKNEFDNMDDIDYYPSAAELGYEEDDEDDQ